MANPESSSSSRLGIAPILLQDREAIQTGRARQGKDRICSPRAAPRPSRCSKNSVHVDYQQHVRDVLTILTYFLSKPPRRSSDLMNNLIDFTLVRTYRLQYLRFVRGDQLWGSNPIRWLHALWHDSDRAATTNIEEALTITDYFTAKMLRERAGLQSTSVDSKGTVFPFNSRNAHRWSHLLLKCLHQFERALGFVPQNAEPALGGDQSRLEQGRAKGERNYKYPAPPKPTKYKDVERARNALRILYNLIRSKAVVHLVPKSFAAIIRSRYDEVRMQDYQSGRYRTTSIKSAAQVLNTLATGASWSRHVRTLCLALSVMS
ncbi:hypothetical protein C8Q76DRAFT_752794 [Earliella scabrosa]|nr:hypothetical protein C8Q76DRAFT_752794 [Earliella scabrosa]